MDLQKSEEHGKLIRHFSVFDYSDELHAGLLSPGCTVLNFNAQRQTARYRKQWLTWQPSTQTSNTLAL